MILAIWVFAVMGDQAQDHGTAYVQMTASAQTHDTPQAREAVEELCLSKYRHDFPGVPVCECGWVRQEVKVWTA